MNINLNLNVRGIPQSPTLAINERSAQLKSNGKKIYKLGLGQSPFPVPESVVEELKRNAFQKDYQPVKGLMALREAVAQYHNRKHGVDCTAEDVLIGPGSKELMFLLQFVYYGDLVISNPAWVSYAPQAQLIGRHVRWIPTRSEDGWMITPEKLSELCQNDPERPRIVILNYPKNPSGVSYNEEELKELAEIARAHKVILLSDEIYAELHHKGEHISISRFYPEGTIISGGLSKWCGAGGWRLGTFTYPKSLRWLQDAMAAMASETYTATSAPIQFAAVRAFQDGADIEEYLWQVRRVLRALGKSITEKMQNCGINVPCPQGAFYLFPDFSKFREKLNVKNSIEFSEKLLNETGVALLPGSVFGRPSEELTARIAYVDFDGAQVLAAAEKIPAMHELGEDFLKINCGNLCEAVDKMCGWLNQ